MIFKFTKGVHFTAKGLAEALNKKYKNKESGVPFDINDAHQYQRRHKIPKKYGGGAITEIEVPGLDKKVLEIKDRKDEL